MREEIVMCLNFSNCEAPNLQMPYPCLTSEDCAAPVPQLSPIYVTRATVPTRIHVGTCALTFFKVRHERAWRGLKLHRNPDTVPYVYNT